MGNGRGGEAAAGFQEPGRCSRCLPAGKGYLPPHPVAIRPSPRPQAASAGWEGGAPGADKIWKREVCVELGAVCSLEQVNVPTSCPSRPWESTSKQPDLQKEGQAWREVGGLGEEREGRKRGARLSPLPPGSLLTTPHVESPEITPGICISMRFRSRIRNRRRVWGIFRRSFPLPLPAKGCLRALAEAVDTGGGQEGGGGAVSFVKSQGSHPDGPHCRWKRQDKKKAFSVECSLFLPHSVSLTMNLVLAGCRVHRVHIVGSHDSPPKTFRHLGGWDGSHITDRETETRAD